MKNSSYFKIASTLLALSVFAGCASLPVQQGEYDDVYFTSADRAQPKKVVINPEGKGDLGEDVVTLQRSSENQVEPELINKYNNGEPTEAVYFEEIEPRVSRASELNYNDFVWDYEHELLLNYDLPVSWDEMDAFTFNDLMSSDFQFRNAWYQQYYRGNLSYMDSYVRNSSAGFNSSRNFNFGFGLGLGIGSLYSPFRTSLYWGDPFYTSFYGFYDPYWSMNVRYRNFRRFNLYWAGGFGGYNWGWGYDPFFDPYYNSWGYSSWAWRNSWYGGRNTIIIVDNDYYGNGRNYTRGGRVPSTSVTSVRSDALNGTGRTRSSANIDAAPTRSRSTISSGRVSNTSVRPVSTTTRSSRSTSSVDEALVRSSRQVRTDAYRFDDNIRSSRNSRSSTLTRNYGSSNRNTSAISNSRTSSPIAYRGASSSSRNSGISFGRSSSSRSSVFTRGSSSSGRSSSGTFNRSRSSSSSGENMSRGSSSSVSRITGGSSRSSSGSSGSSSSSRSSSSSSSGGRGGRGN